MTPVLQARNIRKTFTHPTALDVLKGVDLDVYPGEAIAILGRSGEGKSTLLQILGTLDTPTSGEVHILGKQVGPQLAGLIRNQHIGFIFQSYHLLEDYTVLENVLMPAWIARQTPPSAHGPALLEKVGLTERAHHYGKQLSGGEKQRAAIARALCNDPQILFADEPSGNLDGATAQGIQDLLFQCVQAGKSLIVVTHDLNLARKCHKQYTLKQGLLHLGLD